MVDKSKSAKKTSKTRTSKIMSLVIIVMALITVVDALVWVGKVNDKKKKYDELDKQYKQELAKKAEYEYLLSEDNQLEYIERIAREKYGYVAPGERAFYDSSIGK